MMVLKVRCSVSARFSKWAYLLRTVKVLFLLQKERGSIVVLAYTLHLLVW